MATEERNRFVDIMRGLAMLLVVLGHTMTGSTTGAEESFLFNVVWSLQMPLFILISGYVTRYSRNISSGFELWRFVKRRTLAYMLPWIVWSFLVRGIIFGQTSYLNIKWLLWHMDSGYWFLATIWTISIVFGLSTFLAQKIVKTKSIRLHAVTALFYLIAMAVLAGVAFVAGLSYFAIKLTLYYMPFFFAGYLYGQYRDSLLETRYGKIAKDVVVAMCLAVWLAIITRFHLFAMPDSGIGIVLRAFSSLTGCIAVCGLSKGVYEIETQSGGGTKLLAWSGLHSLEIYLSHYLLLNLLKLSVTPAIGTFQGAGIILINYIITVILVVFAVKMLNGSRIMRFVLYGKEK